MILDYIVENKKRTVELAKKDISEKEIIKIVNERMESNNEGAFCAGNSKFRQALGCAGFNIIGEIKKASPSKGIIVENFNIMGIAKVYDEMPIKAISVLTEEKYFFGSPMYIEQVKSVTSKPILRKDFIIDKYQIYETKLLQCEGMLLIAAVLGNRLHEFYELVLELGIEPLVEVHNEDELFKVMEFKPSIIGINNRDLNTFNVDLHTTERLMKYINKDTIVISESGVRDKADIDYLKSLSVNGALIGESFMRSIDKDSEIKEFFNHD